MNLSKELIYTCDKGIVTLTINRPESMNAWTRASMLEMRDVISLINNDNNTKVLIITGVGASFCAGGDIGLLDSVGLGGKDTRRRIVEPLGMIASVLHMFRHPTIAAINGGAVGGGLSLAMLCDIRIASDKAKLGAAWVRRALVPDVGATYLLPRTIGVDRALMLAFTGEIIDAIEAERIGLVTRVVPHEELMQITNELATKIANGPSVAIELMKRGIYRGMKNDLETQLDFETYAMNVCFKTEDFRESIKAFKESRKASFRGK